MFKSIPIRLNIIINTLAVAGFGILLVLSVQFYFSQKLAESATEKLFDNISKAVKNRMVYFDDRIINNIEYLEELDGITLKPSLSEIHPLRNLITKIMDNLDDIYAMYIGHSDGSFYEIINLELDDNIKNVFEAPAHARWAVIKILGGTGIINTEFLDNRMQTISIKAESTIYNPVKRPWYIKAVSDNALVRTEPYNFSHLKAPGITYAKTIASSGGDAVVGIDISTSALSLILENQKVYKESDVMVMDKNKHIIATTPGFQEALLNDIIKKGIETNGKVNQRKIDGKVFLVKSGQVDSGYWLTDEFIFGIPLDVMIGPYYSIIKISLLVTFIASLILLPAVLLSSSMIVKPLKQLMNENELVRQRRFREIKPVKTNIKEYQDLSRSLVNMANDIESYQLSQQFLFDSFIRLIAEAVDDKSSYTGGHCERVPVLTEMLARAACFSEEEPFKEFMLEGEEEWRELHVSAWLHDCGKLVIPEYVVDKATRLETLYNRIHEIRNRFEIILRDCEIEAYRRKSEGVPPEEAEKWLDEQYAVLQDDFRFIAEHNNGDVPVTDEDMKRIRNIAEREWVRHFDDSIGLSYEEYQQKKEHIKPVPTVEKLLADKPEHIFMRTQEEKDSYLEEGFNIKLPDAVYNHGELHNLSVKRGTLTDEERFRIKEHVVMSIKMLEKLPFPKHLQNVPEYANAHHEAVNGTGYPRGLSKENMSIPARIMAVADIYEALTASDRPYKKAKTLSESVKILSMMAKDGYIDEDIFKLFISSGVYMDYAELFMSEEQIDKIDESLYL